MLLNGDVTNMGDCIVSLALSCRVENAHDYLISQAAGRWHLTAETWVQSTVSPCAIFGRQIGIRTNFLRGVRFSPSVQLHCCSLLMLSPNIDDLKF